MTIDLPYASAKWWSPEFEQTREEAVMKVLKSIESRQDYWARAHLSHARLYDNSPLTGLTPYSYTRVDPLDSEYLSLNIIKNIIDTRTARICRTKPKVAFLTNEGDWFMRRRAKKLEAFSDAAIYETKLYDIDTQLVADVGIFGTAPVKIYADKKRRQLCAERCFLWELIVDDVEAQYGRPRSMYHRQHIERNVAIEEWAPSDSADDIELRAKLKDSRNSDNRDAVWSQSTADMILVVEAWHLPSGPGAEDGRHVICTDNACILDEPYERDRFPFVLMREKKPRTGIWGDSLTNLLAGLQFEVNTILLEIANGMHMIVGHYLVEEGSSVNTAHLNNDLRAIVMYTGVKPEYQTPQIISPEVYAHLWQLTQQMYMMAGLNQEAASGQSPSQYRSGEAVERADDLNTTRQLALGRSREDFYLECVDHFLELAPTIPNYEVRAQKKRFYTPIQWKDIDMRRDDWVLRAYPASDLPNSIGGRLDTLKDMIDLQVLSGPEDVRKLMNMPDLEQSDSLAYVDDEFVDYCIDKILDAEDPDNDGVYVCPNPFIGNLPKAADRARRHLLRAQLDGCPDDNLDKIRQWIAECKGLVDSMNPPVQSAGAPMGASPGPSPAIANAPMSSPIPGAPGASPIPPSIAPSMPAPQGV